MLQQSLNTDNAFTVYFPKQINAMSINNFQQNLLSIPPELRMMIFDYILIHAGVINLPTSSFDADGDPGHHTIESFEALSIQCKQIHYEAESIFFPRNVICFQANGVLPSIPIRCVEKMRTIELCRTLIGKTFVLKMHRSKSGDLTTTVEVREPAEEPSKEATSHTTSQIESIIVGRLTQGARVATRMIRHAVDNGEGMSMKVIRAIAARMNQQWIIAM